MFRSPPDLVGVSVAEALERRDVSAYHHSAGDYFLRLGPGSAFYPSIRL